jgi:hypothetical protein
VVPLGRLALAGTLAAAAACSSAAGGTDSAPRPTYPGADTSRAARGATPPRAGSAVLYRPATTRYVIERHDSLTLELQSARQVQALDRTAYFRVAVTDEQGTLHVTILLDSLVTPAGAPNANDSSRNARGTRWSGTLTPTGRLEGLVGSDTTLIGRQLTGFLPLLFPHLPPGGATSGATWQDTVQTPVQVNAFAATERAVLTYKADGIESRGGARALRLESDGTFEQTGEGAPFGEKMEMKAAGTRHATHFISLEGALLSAEGGDRSELTIAVPSVGQSVPAHQTTSFLITALPAR